MSITVVVENGSIKLPSDVHLPDGTEVEIIMPENTATGPKPDGTLHWMMKYAGAIDGPEDWAAEHDHYTRGTPKHADR